MQQNKFKVNISQFQFKSFFIILCLNYSLFFRLVTMAWLVLVMCAGKWQTTMKSSRPLRLSSCQWSPTCTSTCCWKTSTSRARSSRTTRLYHGRCGVDWLDSCLREGDGQSGDGGQVHVQHPCLSCNVAEKSFHLIQNSELKPENGWLIHSFGIGGAAYIRWGEVHDGAPQGYRHGAGSCHGGGGCIRLCS